MVALAELILIGAGVFALGLALRANLTASLFWIVGIGLWTLAAIVDLCVRLGLDALQPLASYLMFHIETVGVLALLLGSFFSLVYNPSERASRWVAALAVGLLLQADRGVVPMLVVTGLPAMWLAALLGLCFAVWAYGRGRRSAAGWMMAGLALAFAAHLSLGGLLSFGGALPFSALALYFLLSAGMLAAFGLSARRAG